MDEMMTAMQIQMDQTPHAVQVWMNWMMLIFLSSVLFIKGHKSPRWALLAMLLTMPTAMVIFHFTGNVHLFGIAHLIWWLPLLIFLVKNDFQKETLSLKTPYGVWLVLISSTIVISLVFDIRDLYLIWAGAK